MKRLILALLLIHVTCLVNAQKDPIEHIWYNQEKTSKIEIYKSSNGLFYGKIVWLKEPNDANGKPRTDFKNSNPAMQHVPLLHYIILKGFKKDNSDPKLYTDGTVYNPKEGKTYCGKITFEGSGPNTLRLRGSICGFSLLGKSQVWTLAE